MDKKSEKQQLKDWKTFRIDENLNFQIEEQQQYQIRFKKKKTTLRHIIVKLQNIKDKEMILKAARKKKESWYVQEQ